MQSTFIHPVNIMSLRIHILGPSGSGTTTLGKALSEEYSIKHLDTDDYYWKKTEIPFTEKNSPEHRIRSILTDIQDHPSWVLSGSLVSWGSPLIPLFTHVIYLWVPWELREQRLLKREQARYGNHRISEGGDMHSLHLEFMDWASRYDTAGSEQRSRRSHEQWIESLPKRISFIRIEGNYTPCETLEKALDAIKATRSRSNSAF